MNIKFYKSEDKKPPKDGSTIIATFKDRYGYLYVEICRWDKKDGWVNDIFHNYDDPLTDELVSWASFSGLKDLSLNRKGA